MRFQHHVYSKLRPHVRSVEDRGLLYRRRSRSYILNAASSGHPLESEPGTLDTQWNWDTVKNSLDAFYRFSRPHTVIGTVKLLVSINYFDCIYSLDSFCSKSSWHNSVV